MGRAWEQEKSINLLSDYLIINLRLLSKWPSSFRNICKRSTLFKAIGRWGVLCTLLRWLLILGIILIQNIEQEFPPAQPRPFRENRAARASMFYQYLDRSLWQRNLLGNGLGKEIHSLGKEIHMPETSGMSSSSGSSMSEMSSTSSSCSLAIRASQVSLGTNPFIFNPNLGMSSEFVPHSKTPFIVVLAQHVGEPHLLLPQLVVPRNRDKYRW